MKYITHNKQAQYLQACLLVQQFCEVNDLPQPQITEFKDKRYNGIAYPMLNLIMINLNNCKGPAPGSANDDSVQGILAHEYAHVWHWKYGYKTMDCGYTTLMIRYNAEVKPHEKCIGEYAAHRNTIEKIAEGFRVFLLNPNLLATLRPHHYLWFLNLGLQPVVTADWRDIEGPNYNFMQGAARKVDV